MALKFCGVIIFLGSVILIVANWEKYVVDTKGKIVNMEIINLPNNCIGAKVRYPVYFKYNSSIYSKMVRGNYCEEHRIGERVKMKWLKDSDKVLFPNESSLINLGSFALLAIFGLFLMLKRK
jgi:hypothetical protein